MLVIFYAAMAISVCWLLGATIGDALHPLAGICLIADCIMAVSVAQHTSWWLGLLALVGAIFILFALAVVCDTIGRTIVWNVENWMDDRSRERNRKKYQKLGSS